MDYLELDRIPTISDSDLLALAQHIRPLYQDGAKLMVVAGKPDMKWLRETAFTWSPRFDGPARHYHRVGCIITYHTYGAPSLFKPSVAECISQIRAQVPAEWLTRIMGFCLDSSDLTAWHCLSDGYHFTKCWLYERVLCDEGQDHGTIIGHETHMGPVITAAAARRPWTDPPVA